MGDQIQLQDERSDVLQNSQNATLAATTSGDEITKKRTISFKPKVSESPEKVSDPVEAQQTQPTSVLKPVASPIKPDEPVPNELDTLDMNDDNLADRSKSQGRRLSGVIPPPRQPTFKGKAAMEEITVEEGEEE